jgi:hypothetical protein
MAAASHNRPTTRRYLPHARRESPTGAPPDAGPSSCLGGGPTPVCRWADPARAPEKFFSKKCPRCRGLGAPTYVGGPTRGPRLNRRRPIMQRSQMSSTRTIGRAAAVIGAGIAALAISVSAADIASARPNICDPGISCPPPPQQPGNPPHPGPGTYPPYDDSAPPLFPAPQGGPTPVPFPPCTTQPGGCL